MVTEPEEIPPALHMESLIGRGSTPDAFSRAPRGSPRDDSDDPEGHDGENPLQDVRSQGEQSSQLSGSKSSMTPRTLQARIDIDFDPEHESYEEYATRLRSYLAIGAYQGYPVDQGQLAYKLVRAEAITGYYFATNREEQVQNLREQLATLVSEEPELGTEEHTHFALRVRAVQDLLQERGVSLPKPISSPEAPGQEEPTPRPRGRVEPQPQATFITPPRSPPTARMLDFGPSRTQAVQEETGVRQTNRQSGVDPAVVQELRDARLALQRAEAQVRQLTQAQASTELRLGTAVQEARAAAAQARMGGPGATAPEPAQPEAQAPAQAQAQAQAPSRAWPTEPPDTMAGAFIEANREMMQECLRLNRQETEKRDAKVAEEQKKREHAERQNRSIYARRSKSVRMLSGRRWKTTTMIRSRFSKSSKPHAGSPATAMA